MHALRAEERVGRAPQWPDRIARFLVIGAEPLAALQKQLGRYEGSPLTRGVLYAEAGLREEADAEFRKALNAGADPEVAQELLRSVQDAPDAAPAESTPRQRWRCRSSRASPAVRSACRRIPVSSRDGPSVVWTILVSTGILSLDMRSTPEQAEGATQRFDSPEQEAFLSLWRTYDRLKLFEDELFGRYDLSAQQYNALRLLRGAHPGKVPTLTLAGQLVSRAPDITRLLDRLDARGLIERERSIQDRRTVRVGITEAGRRLLAELAAEVRKCHERQLGHLSPDELRLLTDLLRRARAPHEPLESRWR